MKDIGEAITAVVLLGIRTSILLGGLVTEGSGFPSKGFETCQIGNSGDCTLHLFLIVWMVAALTVGSVYFAIRIRHGTGRHAKESPVRIQLNLGRHLVIVLWVAYRNQIKQIPCHFE